MFDLISIGDCTTDHIFKISQAHLEHIRRGETELCLAFGQKIPVEAYTESAAGNNVNNAIGLARLGLRVGIYTNVGADASGERIVKKLKEEHVDTRYVKINLGMNSNVSAVIDYQGERSILVYHQPWEYELPDLERTKWIYLSSLAASFAKSNIIAQLENFLERTGTRIAFNPGTYQLKSGIKKFPKLLSLLTVLIVNLDEAQIITGEEIGGKAEVKKLLKMLAALGPKYIVITDGANGSYGFDGDKFYRLEAFPAKLVEMTGAGDAYASGLLAGMIYGKDLTEAMRWGAANGASVIEQIGSQKGLLTYQKLQDRLKEDSKVMAKEM